MTAISPLPDAERDRALSELLEADRREVMRAAKLLAEDRVPATTGRLIALLDKATNADSRQGILYALSWHGGRGLCDLFIRVLLDPSEHDKVRGQAAEGLAYSFHELPQDSCEMERGVAAVLAALEVPSAEVRYNAVFAAGASKHPAVVPVLKKLLSDNTPAPGWSDTIGRKAADALDAIYWPADWRNPSEAP